MTTVHPVEAAARDDGKFDRRAAIAAIARAIRRSDFGTGPLASLRRNEPGTVLGQPAFHRLIADIPDDHLIGRQSRIRWATVIHAMAIGARLDEKLPDMKAGEALATAGVSEARFSKLLASRDETFRHQVVLVARHVHGKNIGFDWRDFGELVLVVDWNEARAEMLRFNIARDYYRAVDRLDAKKTA
mgnify:CR=1 FL=1